MSKPQIIAFYLPQFHPIPENDEWWGKGFTEWTNVAKAKPLFPGHYQPRIPADLGFYDLRLPEVREEQARMAKEAGIDAFCYWHYWLGNGKQLLEKPLQEVVKLGKPDFPFCLGWANHSWYRQDWNKDVSRFSKEILIEQTYPDEDDIKNHFYAMLDTFKDSRYYKTQDGQLVFLIYDCKRFPDIDSFIQIWQKLAKENGLSQFFFIGYASDLSMLNNENLRKCDAITLSLLGAITGSSFFGKVKKRLCLLFRLPINIISYKSAINKWEHIEEIKKEKIYPTTYPNWDHSPRSGQGGFIVHHSTPALFEHHLKTIIEQIKNKTDKNQIIFIKSWNEWAEGNYLEPDLKFGKGYLEALKKALTE
jgi:hypothetical protein